MKAAFLTLNVLTFTTARSPPPALLPEPPEPEETICVASTDHLWALTVYSAEFRTGGQGSSQHSERTGPKGQP